MGRARRTTLQDIATVVGVSANTVSRALAGKSDISSAMRTRIVAEAERQGYVPNSMARSLVLGSAMTIGVVITNPSNPFYARLISAIEQRSGALGYSLLLMVSEENVANERRAIDTMLRWGVDGAVVVPVQTEIDHWQRLAGARTPVVLVNRSVPDLGWDMVGIDYERGAYDAAIHLLDRGARRLYLLEEDLEISTVTDRLNGYARAVSERGGDAEVLRVPTRRDNSSTLPWEAAEAYQIATGIAGSVRPGSAVMVGSDYFALGVYRALSHAGVRIPDDVAVVGFGDHPFSAYLTPALSSVRLPAEQVGRAAVDQLISRLADREITDGPSTVRFPSELIVRESSSPPPSPSPSGPASRSPKSGQQRSKRGRG